MSLLSFSNVLLSIFVVGTLLPTSIVAHGYISWPAARQYKCFRDNNFWWPETGDDIPDDACRDAYRVVYSKYRNAGGSSGVAANAAQYMFQQYYEYAAIAGARYEDVEHVQKNVVKDYLCAAGAADRAATFGDKSGMDAALKSWRPEVLYGYRAHLPYTIEINFCPTAVHEPSYFEVWISKPQYDYADRLQWSDLISLPLAGEAVLVANEGDDEQCAHTLIYKIPVVVPWRDDKFVIYVRWQRNDIAGEGFYNCADVVFDKQLLETAFKVNDEL
ncbi:gp37 [Lambdina fiscellaria nucleopolyhedrovirus]|uniref:Gp37 n=1 Tax=Lambdina fiscellaria nucleopolyhedrovirus TaxID=1642929 RepID=A0A0E3Z624_9ABAC|nr:gp37 [Lambdina fiscellaria nucleopolyhedrovirus]AKC91707.1 gp37 [Lambdina fiscellaria nucleopolyhedrovirus]